MEFVVPAHIQAREDWAQAVQDGDKAEANRLYRRYNHLLREAVKAPAPTTYRVALRRKGHDFLWVGEATTRAEAILAARADLEERGMGPAFAWSLRSVQ